MPPGHIKESIVIPGNFFIDTYILIYIFKTLDVEPSVIPVYVYHLHVTAGQPVDYTEFHVWLATLPAGRGQIQIHLHFN